MPSTRSAMMVSRIRPSSTLSGLQASGLCSAAHFMRAVSRGDDACFVSVFCGALLAPEDELPPGESTTPSFEVVSDSCPARDCSPTDDEHGTEHCATASDADGHHHLLLICPAPFGVMMDCGLPLHRNRERVRTSAPAECVNSRLTIVLMRSVREGSSAARATKYYVHQLRLCAPSFLLPRPCAVRGSCHSLYLLR